MKLPSSHASSDGGRQEEPLAGLLTTLFLLLLPLTVLWPLARPLVPDVLYFFVTPSLLPTDLLLGGMAILLLRRRREVRVDGGALLLAGIAALAWLSTVWALEPVLAAYSALRWSLPLIVYFWFALYPRRPERAALTFLVGMTLQGAIGLAQVLVQQPLGLPAELALAPELSGAAVIPVQGVRWLRAYGLTFHPNVLGGLLVAALLLALPLLDRRGGRWLWCSLWPLLILSFSRGAWLAAALTVPIAILWLAFRWPALRRPLATGAAGALLLTALTMAFWWPQLSVRLGPLASRVAPAGAETTAVAPEESRSVNERVEQLGLARRLAAHRPLTGIGAGNFPVAMQRAGLQQPPQYVHNVPWLLAAEIGLPGAALWVLLVASGAGQFLTHRRPASPWPTVALLAWLALAVTAMVDFYPWALEPGRLLSATLLGLASRAGAGTDQPDGSSS